MFDIIIIEHIVGENKYFMRTKVVIKNKIRFSIIIGLLIIFLFIILILSVGESKQLDSFEKSRWIYVTVKEGDTLWSISKSFVDQTVDIRDYIHFIRKINDLNSADIYPGEILKFVHLKDYKILCQK